ncbi:peptidase S8/S53 domain-containing protein [Dactylonectria macrodidyma]|uniref:Peptidase S8/S53 domain-containing protein n=1 Tax=Dactylonectria macrodidyma TaxID=307937 RepID=A0A9P9EPU5_9HYPO|nr:peptidase S8/S53 domain-containing protein [Dactylonectria macrodidyma]
MNFHMFFLPWLLLVFVPLSTTANMNLPSERIPEFGKGLYTVFPKEGTDISATAGFIKSTVQNHDLYPSAEVGEQLMSWTVEASPSEVTKLESYDGIVRVVKLEVPAQQEKKRRQKDLPAEGRYTIYPVDRNNQDQCKAIGASLDALLNDEVREPRRMNDMIQSWVAVLTIDQVRQVEGIDGVKAVCRVHRGRRGRMAQGLSKLSTSPKLSSRLKRRDMTYETQKNAVPELVAIGQPSTIPVLKDLKNYEPSTDDDDDVDDGEEEDLPFHSTCTAGKALGTQFGASKKATHVVVKLDHIDSAEFEDALDLIIQDLDENPERRKNSVVTMSLGMGQEWEDELIRDVRGKLENLFARDVPFVCNAGNIESNSNSAEVDEYPALLEGPDLPLIVVGFVNSEGERSGFSQAGPHVTIHALGEDVRCLPKDKDSAMEMDGTSFAAPLVASEIANLLSYEAVPFDTSDGSLVRNLKAYLQSEKGGWERIPGIRVIWNGVTEENNPSENVHCNSLEGDIYVKRGDVKSLAENDVCLGAEGTPNKVTLSMDLEPVTNIKQYGEDCAKYLMMAVDGCGNPSSAIPANYNGGGVTNTARFRTGVFQKSCVGNAISRASGIDLGCKGTG